jgi:probable HAF family extracellular repeat protein
VKVELPPPPEQLRFIVTRPYAVTGPFWASRVKALITSWIPTEGAGMTDLGHLGGGRSTALAINNTGIAVGTSTIDNGTSRVFRWTQAEGMVDLNTLLPPNSGWVLDVVHDVNDRGQIAGEGLHNGQRRAFRYNPPGLTEAAPVAASAKAARP